MKNKNVLFIVLICLCISLLGISVGFSAMSTTLSVNGYASFKPVDMIRVVYFSKDTLYNVTESKASYKPDSINVVLTMDGIDGYATYNVKITNLGEVNKELKEINSSIYSNNDIKYNLDGFNIGDVLKAHETKEFKITFKYKEGIEVTDNTLNAIMNFVFEDYVEVPLPYDYEYYSEGECIFNGKNNNVVGECTKGVNADYVNTKVMPFSADNIGKNFILTFTLTSLENSRLGSGKRDTFMSALYEANDNIVGRYPGVLFRVEDGKLNIHASNGMNNSSYAVDVKFNKDDVINKEIKIIRYNDGERIKLYYTLGGDGPYLLMDISELTIPFDTPLTFGAFLAPNGVTTDRHAIGTMSNLTFRYVNGEDILTEFNKTITPTEPDIIFDEAGPCIFNGANSNIIGCDKYSDTNYINTGVYLLNEENYKKDFDLSFTLSGYTNSKQEVAQVTIMNAFLERTGKGYGMLLRRNGNNLNLIIRDGTGLEKSLTYSVNDTMTFRIVKKGNSVCYNYNNTGFKYALSYEKLVSFNVPVTFGASIDSKGVPFRYINGTMSDMHIQIGSVDSSIICNPSMN